MDEPQRLWADRWLEPISEATVAELLALRDLHRGDVTGHFIDPDPLYMRPEQVVALELLVDRTTVPAGELTRRLGSRGRYWQFRSILEKFHYAVDWPDSPDVDRPLRIEGRVLPGVPRALWDLLARYASPRTGSALDLVGTFIEVIPLEARPEVVHLIVEFVGPIDVEVPSYTEPLTGDWAEWVEENRALCAVAYGPEK